MGKSTSSGKGDRESQLPSGKGKIPLLCFRATPTFGRFGCGISHLWTLPNQGLETERGFRARLHRFRAFPRSVWGKICTD
eukprot:1358403-Rhodomonas_salina.1